MAEERETGGERIEELQLWCADPDDLIAPEAAEACLALLNADELARYERFRFAGRRREHLATHALKRIALSASFAQDPEAWRFQQNAHGKPSIDAGRGQDCELQFNLSNSPKLVVCLIAHGREVGVDVEPCSRAAKIAKVATEVFSPAEREQLALLSEPERLERALSLWTLKEAYIKARGKGLALPLAGFSFLFDGPLDIHLEFAPGFSDDPSRWRFCVLNHREHRIAAIVESRSPLAMNFWEARPPVAPPARLDASRIIWFPRR